MVARAKEANVKFNKEKIQYKVSSVNYMGHIVISEGVKADEAKVKAYASRELTLTKKSSLSKESINMCMG